MTDYVRPPLPQLVFRDASGAVIEYGNRWKGESPPEDAYSVTSHLERFAPLHDVAEALIEHLRFSYKTTVTEDNAFAGDLIRQPQGVLRAVRVTPSDPDAATLTFVLTPFPGVIVHAGLLQDFAFPDCGCDACDESLEDVVGELEWRVLAVVTGGYSEFIRTQGELLQVSFELIAPDGGRADGGTQRPSDFPANRLRNAEVRLSQLPFGWQPWEPR